jgi:hypothetical protein
MGYEIKISDDKSFVIIHVKKQLSPEVALTFTQESIELAKKHNINNYLFDVREIKHSWGVLETYQFAQNLKNSGRKRLDKVALLVAPTDQTFSFVETVTVNQGYNTRLFTNYDEATVWLKDGIALDNAL